jgi:pyruvate/2-oxoglutarate dehydrogenase complex dihydrolipoamide dehydrogenase (E3) component
MSSYSTLTPCPSICWCHLLQDEGIAIITSANVDRVSGRSGDGVALHATIDGMQKMVEGSHLLVALGKTPNTTGIGLEHAGIELTPAGYVRVNDRLETTAPAVWAMGDRAGSPAFTHMSFEDFRIVRDNLHGKQRSTRGRQVPFCLFIEPELARVGLNEVEARRQGVAYRLTELPISSILRTRTTAETRGKLKALIGEDDRILGFTALGPRAGELLPPVQIAMRTGLSYHAIEELIVAHIPLTRRGSSRCSQTSSHWRPDMVHEKGTGGGLSISRSYAVLQRVPSFSPRSCHSQRKPWPKPPPCVSNSLVTSPAVASRLQSRCNSLT